ncbi:MAG: hypothetical protein ACRD04_03660 [Terriglobales bacterium]
MSGFEKATLQWAKAAVVMAAFAAVFACLQWCEMRQEGKDTHTLAIAAKQQSEAIRPRLVISGLTPQPPRADGLPVDQGKLHVWFEVPNYGPLVADNVKLCEFDAVDAPKNIARLPYGNCRSSVAWGFGSPMIPPVTELDRMQAPGWGMDGSKTLTEADIDGLRQPNGLEAVFSVLATYEDAGAHVHHAESCILFTFQPDWGVGTTDSQTIGSWSSKSCPWKNKND